jgi:O-antigen/teichoic acid export membrane protein
LPALVPAPAVRAPSEDHAGLRWILFQSGWAGTFEVGGMGLRFVLALLIARLFGPEGLGTYTLALAFASGAALVGVLGMDRASTRFIALHRARAEQAAVVGMSRFATIVSLAALLFLAAGAIEQVWHQPGLAGPVAVIALAIPAIALGAVWREGLRGFQDVRLASLLEKVGVPGLTAVALLVAVVGGIDGVNAVAVAVVFAYLATTLVAGAQLWKRVAGPNAPAPIYHRRTWTRFAALMSLEGVLLFVLQWTDQLMVGLFQDAHQVGVYASALRLAMLVAVPLLAVNSIMGPTAAALHGAGETERLRVTFSRMTWATAVVGLVVGAVLIVLGPWLLGLFGPEFVVGYPALLVLVVGQIVNAATGSVGVILGMTGHAGRLFVNAGLTAVLTVVLNLLLVPRLGILGAALATSISLATVNIVRTVQVRQVLGFWAYDPRQLAFWLHGISRYSRRGVLRTGFAEDVQ